MQKKKKSFPVFTRAMFVDVAKYVEPTIRNNRPTHGYAVGIVQKDEVQHTVLIPYEEFPKESIPKFLNKELNVKLTHSGLRTSLAMQEIEDLKESQELIAVNLQNMENRQNQRFDQLEEHLILIDQDLCKFREIFKIWNGFDQHALPPD